MASKKPKLETHPLITRLGVDPKDPRELVPLVGYLGPSSREDHWRIYHSRDFSFFTDVPEEAIVDAQPERPDRVDGPTVVYLKQGARVQVTRVETKELSRRFLSGEIARDNLPGAAGDEVTQMLDLKGATCGPTFCPTCYER